MKGENSSHHSNVSQEDWSRTLDCETRSAPDRQLDKLLRSGMPMSEENGPRHEGSARPGAGCYSDYGGAGWSSITMTMQFFDIMSQPTYFWQTNPFPFRSIGPSPLSAMKPDGQTKFPIELSTSSISSTVTVPSELVVSLRQK